MNNYTVSPFTADIAEGSNLPSTVVLTITPEPEYVVSASEFSIGESLPAQLSNPVFADTTSPGELSNTVTLTLTTDPSYTVPGNDVEFLVDIDGDAQPWDANDGSNSNAVDLTGTFVFEEDNNYTTTFTAETGFTSTATTFNGYDGFVVSGTGKTADRVVKAGSITINAASGYYFNKGLVSNLNYGFTKNAISTSTNRATPDVDGYQTSIKTDVFFSTERGLILSDEAVALFGAQATTKTVLTNVITGAEFGPEVAPTAGDYRKITIYGSGGASVSLALRDGNGVAQPGYPKTITIPGDHALGSHEFYHEIPELKSSSPASYTFNMTANSGTTIQSGVPNNYRINQYPNITLTISYDLGGIRDVTLPADITFTGPALESGVNLDYRDDFDSQVEFELRLVKTVGSWVSVASPTWDASVMSNSDGDRNGGTYFTALKCTAALENGNRDLVLRGTFILDSFGISDVASDIQITRIATDR